ncbi:hypothetical protein KRX57_08405 [Weeksellaceae bacterium TAE3-ERU29]|nr:hypothetical protein [Weeksellaceae bacterium TAE3-ERU29]
MKYSTIIGLVLLVVGLILFIVNRPDYMNENFYTAGFLGLGIGLLIGGFLGFAQKKRKKVVETVFKPAEPVNTSPIEEQKVEDNSGLKF